MESEKVIKLREQYGILDTQNEYSEDEIIHLSKQRLYFLTSAKDDWNNKVYIKWKQVPGYISEKFPCIFINDKEVTGRNHYVPVILIKNCKEIKEGIYQEIVGETVYCTTDDLELAKSCLREVIEENIQDNIKEVEMQLQTLKSTVIIVE